jgi:hypothetical protein
VELVTSLNKEVVVNNIFNNIPDQVITSDTEAKLWKISNFTT